MLVDEHSDLGVDVRDVGLWAIGIRHGDIVAPPGPASAPKSGVSSHHPAARGHGLGYRALKRR